MVFQAKMGPAGAAKAIVQLLATYPTDALVLQWGCAALAAMAKKHPANQLVLFV